MAERLYGWTLLLAWVVAAACLALASRGAAAASAPKPFISAMVAPTVLPADGATTSALYLELIGPTGQAVSRTTPTTIRLQSQDPAVATVPPVATIPAGGASVVVRVTTTYVAGTAVFVLSAPGLAAAQASLTTATAATVGAGGSIKLLVNPAHFLRESAGPAWATVELLNASGIPELAQSPVTLNLLSSHPAGLEPPATVTVPAGQFSATVQLRAGVPGPVTLTALGDGFNPGIATTSVDKPGTAPVQLEATVQPPLLLPGAAARLVLQAVDANGVPVAFPCGTVFLSSNAPAIVDVPTSATPTCAGGAESVVVATGAAATSGTASLTVAAAGLTPVTVKVEVGAASPGKLSATVAPMAFTYGASPEGWLVVQVQSPAGAPQAVPRALEVTLAGGAGAVPAQVIIPQGQSSAQVPIADVSARQAPEVVASAPGLASARVALVPAARSLASTLSGVGVTRGLVVFGRRIAFKWIFLVQVVVVVALAVGLLLSGGRRGRRAA